MLLIAWLIRFLDIFLMQNASILFCTHAMLVLMLKWQRPPRSWRLYELLKFDWLLNNNRLCFNYFLYFFYYFWSRFLFYFFNLYNYLFLLLLFLIINFKFLLIFDTKFFDKFFCWLWVNKFVYLLVKVLFVLSDPLHDILLLDCWVHVDCRCRGFALMNC